MTPCVACVTQSAEYKITVFENHENSVGIDKGDVNMSQTIGISCQSLGHCPPPPPQPSEA